MSEIALNLCPMPVIVGAPRSGTTLLRFMLDAHPDLAIPPETGFLGADLTQLQGLSRRQFADFIEKFPADAPGWSDFGLQSTEWRQALDGVEPFDLPCAFRSFYRLYAARFSKSRWGEKTPGNVFKMEQIEALLPESHFIHLIRDGRDVALSWRKTWFSPGQDIKTLAHHWQQSVRVGMESGIARRHYLAVHFEELIENTAAVLQRICDYLSLDFQPSMLNYFENTPIRLLEHGERRRVDGSLLVGRDQRLQQQLLTTYPPARDRVGAWRDTLTAFERDAFASVAGDLLSQLGYEP